MKDNNKKLQKYLAKLNFMFILLAASFIGVILGIALLMQNEKIGCLLILLSLIQSIASVVYITNYITLLEERSKSCKHDKCYSPIVIVTVNPNRRQWICRKCFKEGSEEIVTIKDKYEYFRLKKQKEEKQ